MFFFSFVHGELIIKALPRKRSSIISALHSCWLGHNGPHVWASTFVFVGPVWQRPLNPLSEKHDISAPMPTSWHRIVWIFQCGEASKQNIPQSYFFIWALLPLQTNVSLCTWADPHSWVLPERWQARSYIICLLTRQIFTFLWQELCSPFKKS